MPRRVIVIFPAIPETSPIHELRRRFDPLATLVPPHITLVFPFESDLDKKEIEDHVRESTANMRPFPVLLQQVTGHEGEYLFLNVKQGNDRLIALHDSLYDGPLADYLSYDQTFVPHMTVGRFADQVAWREAVSVVAGISVSHDIVVDAISVYVIESDGNRRVETVVAL